MKKLVRSAVLTVATVGVPGSGSAQLPESRILTLEVAEIIAEGALAKCRSDGLKVTVIVVDSLNAPKVLIRDDGAVATSYRLEGQIDVAIAAEHVPFRVEELRPCFGADFVDPRADGERDLPAFRP